MSHIKNAVQTSIGFHFDWRWWYVLVPTLLMENGITSEKKTVTIEGPTSNIVGDWKRALEAPLPTVECETEYKDLALFFSGVKSDRGATVTEM